MKRSFLLLILISCFSCHEPTARRPIGVTKNVSVFTQYTKETKRIQNLENRKIATLIAKDSSTIYQVSPYGFWYTYVQKNENESLLPKPGNQVTFQYDIRSLNNEIIYAKELLGLKKYRVDQEDFIPAIQHGIKLMKLGETITFVIPFYNAFGIAGDGHKIGIKQSIKSTVTLININ